MYDLFLFLLLVVYLLVSALLLFPLKELERLTGFKAFSLVSRIVRKLGNI